ALPQRHRADLHGDVLALGVDDGNRGIRHLRVAENLPREQLPRSPSVFGRHNRGELTSDLIADHHSRRLIHPADDPRAVDHVARHVDVLERPFEVGSHRLERFDRHVSSYTEIRRVHSTVDPSVAQWVSRQSRTTAARRPPRRSIATTEPRWRSFAGRSY